MTIERVSVPVERIQHLLDYWNGNANERAMLNALSYILQALEDMLKIPAVAQQGGEDVAQTDDGLVERDDWHAFRERWRHFQDAYRKACDTSHPHDWCSAAGAAQQIYWKLNATYDRAQPVEAAAALERQAGEVCAWTQQDDEDSDLWETSCGHAWCINEGSPMGNSMKFCHGCGKPIDQQPFKYEADPDDEPAHHSRSGERGMKNHLYDDGKVIHACECSDRDGVHPYLVWTVCKIDVPASASFKSDERATCEKCVAGSAK